MHALLCSPQKLQNVGIKTFSQKLNLQASINAVDECTRLQALVNRCAVAAGKADLQTVMFEGSLAECEDKTAFPQV